MTTKAAMPVLPDALIEIARWYRDGSLSDEKMQSAIRAAVGSGKPYAWEHGLTVEGQRMPQLSYDKKHPFGKRGVDHGGTVDSLPLYASQSVAVGGEAAAWITPNALSVLRDPSNEKYSVYAEIYDTRFIEACNNITADNMIPLYASPAATVDVGAKECRWTYDTDTLTDTAWDTECGHRHQFTSDGPAENEHKFCPYCGGKLAALIGEKA